MARFASVARQGYWAFPVGKGNPPTAGDYIDREGDTRYIDAIADAIEFEDKTMPIADLTAGDGFPIYRLAQRWDMKCYGNELDRTRGRHAQQYFDYDKFMIGDCFKVELPLRSLAFLHNNPPYQDGADEDEERTEIQAIELMNYVASGGLMTYVTYVHHLNMDVLVRLCKRSSSVDIYRIPGDHLGEYCQTVAMCVVDPDNAFKPMERAQKLFDFIQNPDAIPLVSQIPFGKYKLSPKSKRQFYFSAWSIDREVLTKKCVESGPQHDQRAATLFSIDSVDEVIRPPMAPREMQIKQMIVSGLFNGIILQTERGLCAVRTTIREIEEQVSNEEDSEQKKVVYQTSHKMEVKLLYENGSVEDLSDEKMIEEFVGLHLEAFGAYAKHILKPLYNFDFVGGTPEHKYQDGALYPFLRAIRLAGKPMHPGQMHVAAAAIVASLERGSVIVNAAPGFGKSLTLNAILSTIHQISKIRWENKVNEQPPTLQTFIRQYKNMLMRPGMFSVITAPSHITKVEDEEEESKWLREVAQAIPDVYARFVKNAEQLTFFTQHCKENPHQLHILITSKEMAKDGEGWKPAYVMKHARVNNLLTQQREIHYLPHGAEDGQIIAQVSKQTVRIVEERELKDAQWWYSFGDYGKHPQNKKHSRRGLQGNYDRKGLAETKFPPLYSYPLWQESRGHSKNKKDIGKILAEKTGMRDALNAEWNRRGIPFEIDEDRASYIRRYKATRIEDFRMIPQPDLLHDWSISKVDYRIEKNYKVPLAQLISKLYSQMLYCYIPDELHQMKGLTGVNAGKAFQQLSHKAKILIGATGSLFGGVASSMRSILFVFNRSLRYRYPWGKANQKWISDMGRIERIVVTKKDNSSNTRTGTKDSKREIIHELPGASPLLLKEFVECCITAGLEDLGRTMPPLDEIPHPVKLDEDVKKEYDFHAGSTQAGALWGYVNRLLQARDVSVLSMYFHTMLKYADMPYDNIQAIHNRMGADHKLEDTKHVATLKGFGRDRIYPKERAVLDLLMQEHQLGRNCALYVNHTGDHGEINLQERYNELIKKELGFSVYSLNRSIDTSKREKVLQGKNVNVLTTNPMLVETGLDLLEFPTLIFVETPYSYYTMAQAGGRHWRANQTRPCKTYYMYYEGTMQHRGVILMGKKASADAFLMGRKNGSLAAFLGDKDDGKGLIDSLIRNMNNNLQLEDASALFMRANASDAEGTYLNGEVFEEPARVRPRIILPEVQEIFVMPKKAKDEQPKRVFVNLNPW